MVLMLKTPQQLPACGALRAKKLTGDNTPQSATDPSGARRLSPNVRHFHHSQTSLLKHESARLAARIPTPAARLADIPQSVP